MGGAWSVCGAVWVSGESGANPAVWWPSAGCAGMFCAEGMLRGPTLFR